MTPAEVEVLKVKATLMMSKIQSIILTELSGPYHNTGRLV
jgi:hypothetical protein